MQQSSGGPGFALKPRDKFTLEHVLWRNNLERDRAICAFVHGQIHGSHSAFAQQSFNAVFVVYQSSWLNLAFLHTQLSQYHSRELHPKSRTTGDDRNALALSICRKFSNAFAGIFTRAGLIAVKASVKLFSLFPLVVIFCCNQTINPNP
jgi:hypothetical protein